MSREQLIAVCSASPSCRVVNERRNHVRLCIDAASYSRGYADRKRGLVRECGQAYLRGSLAAR